MASVRLEHVGKKFGSKSIVTDLSLEVKDHEFFVLLGPSGCGKTTTLNMIAGLEPITAGSLYFDEEKINEKPVEHRNVAMVFQGFALYPHMDAYDNIAFPLKLRKVPKDQIDKKVKEVASKLQISELLHRRPFQMSGGERQRVGLARAIVRNPSVFLLDEPLSNIDAKLRVEMRTELIRLHKELETTMIYVTHDQVEALTMADRIAVMNKGKILQLGEPMEIYHNPTTKFVAGFMGSPPMNFMEVTLSLENGQQYLKAPNLHVEIPVTMARKIQQRTSSTGLVLGIRPSNVEIFTQRTSPAQQEGEVYAVQPLGTETIVDIDVGGLIIKSVTPGTFKAEAGTKVWFSFGVDSLHVFDKGTEEAII